MSVLLTPVSLLQAGHPLNFFNLSRTQILSVAVESVDFMAFRELLKELGRLIYTKSLFLITTKVLSDDLHRVKIFTLVKMIFVVLREASS